MKDIETEYRQQAGFARPPQAPDHAPPDAVVPRPADDEDHDHGC